MSKRKAYRWTKSQNLHISVHEMFETICAEWAADYFALV